MDKSLTREGCQYLPVVLVSSFKEIKSFASVSAAKDSIQLSHYSFSVFCALLHKMLNATRAEAAILAGVMKKLKCRRSFLAAIYCYVSMIQAGVANFLRLQVEKAEARRVCSQGNRFRKWIYDLESEIT